MDKTETALLVEARRKSKSAYTGLLDITKQEAFRIGWGVQGLTDTLKVLDELLIEHDAKIKEIENEH